VTVRMTHDEAWETLVHSTTGILTTLRRDGRPVALPVWFVALDRRVFVATRGKKVERARHDPRCSFLVEHGDRWSELRAVHLDCHAVELDGDDERRPVIARALAEKYAALRTKAAAMPEATRDQYARATGAVLELVPEQKMLTWDNRKLS
jgi:nitroimidazol reductase NimA-like FMN-containing flavoprotein (pyridoxamine 5'-phosphate oxidase superfamily)